MRPSAFSAALGHDEAYANKTKEQLVADYRSDVGSCRLVNERTPPKDWQSGAVRVVQWNVKNLCDPDGMRQGDQEFADAIFGLDADIVVLQECGRARDRIYDHTSRVGQLAGKLFAAGFEIFPVGVDMPILLATRLPVEFFEAVPLDRDFYGSGRFVAAFAQLSLRGGRRVGVYGIHLNHHCRDHRGARLDQIRALLRHAKERVHPDTPLIVVGDFNQQRRRDYHPLEWQHLVTSMNQRGEPLDDGVCYQLEVADFTCCLDSPQAARNWSSDQPPPLTHWTGTIVDYAFARNLKLQGVFVEPRLVSDHLPVVTDWTFGEERPAKRFCCSRRSPWNSVSALLERWLWCRAPRMNLP